MSDPTGLPPADPGAENPGAKGSGASDAGASGPDAAGTEDMGPPGSGAGATDPGDCERCRSLAAGTPLSPEDARWVGEHLAHCSRCAAAEDVAEALIASEMAQALPVSRELHTRLLQIPNRERRLRLLAPLTLPLAALTCVVGAGLIWLVLNGPAGPPDELARAMTPTRAPGDATGAFPGTPETEDPRESGTGAIPATPLAGTIVPTAPAPLATQMARAEGSPVRSVRPNQTPSDAPRDRGDRATSVPAPSETSLPGGPGDGDDAPPTTPAGGAGQATATPTSPERGLVPSVTPTDAPDNPPTAGPPAPPPSTETPLPPATRRATSPPATPPQGTPTAMATQPPGTPEPQTPGTPAQPPASSTPLRDLPTVTATASLTPTLTATPSPAAAAGARSTSVTSDDGGPSITGLARLRLIANRPYSWRPMPLVALPRPDPT